MTLERTRWDIVGLALAAGYIVGLQVGKVPPALPILQDELGMTRVAAGLVASSFYGIGAVLGVPGGLLADRLGPMRLVIAGGLVMAIAGLAGGFAANGALLLATRLVEGFGFLALTVASPKLIGASRKAQGPLHDPADIHHGWEWSAGLRNENKCRTWPFFESCNTSL